MFRNLHADEIECRIGTMKDRNNAQAGYSILLYKDARCDMQILDETVGPFNWDREHKELKNVIYCGVTISNDDGKATKWDCGTESNTEAQKGEASDSFKRACVNWGIGRELYTAPFIWVKGYDKYEKFKVSHIEYEGKRITGLVITDGKGKTAYTLRATDRPHPTRVTPDQVSELTALIMTTNTDVQKFFDYFGVDEVTAFTQEQYAKAVAMLNAKITHGLPEAMR